jgi:Sel1 repeat
MSICCIQCGSNNNSGNRLCLTCGSDLFESREPLARTMPSEQPSVTPSSESSVVTSTAERTEGVTYLFQDETSHARRYLALALIGLTVAVVAWQWRDLRILTSRFLQNSAAHQSSMENSTQANASLSSEELRATQSVHAEPSPSELTSKHDQTTPEDTFTANPSPERSVTAPGSSKGQAQSVSTSAKDRDISEAEGEKYLYGDGVPADCDRAQQNLLSAAEHSSVKAEGTLGTMYATGHCTIRDLPLAYRWFERAQRQNPRNRIIAEDMRVLWDQMSPEEKKLAKR